MTEETKVELVTSDDNVSPKKQSVFDIIKKFLAEGAITPDRAAKLEHKFRVLIPQLRAAFAKKRAKVLAKRKSARKARRITRSHGRKGMKNTGGQRF